MVIRKDWIYLYFKNWFYISLQNPFKTMNKLKGTFKPLQCQFNFGKHWNPVMWCSKPAYFQIITQDVGWKDKYNTPRYETPPYVWIYLFGFNLVWYWDLHPYKTYLINEYWEQALWYLYYYGNNSYGRLNAPDIEKAKESWPWQNVDGTSNWIDSFLI